MSAFFDFARQQTDDNEISVSVVLRCHDNEISVSVVPTTFNGRVGEEVRRQPEEGRRHVARPEKKGVDGYTARSQEVGDWHARARGWMGTREERDWVRPFGRAGPGGFSGVQLHHRETTVGPGPLPPRKIH